MITTDRQHHIWLPDAKKTEECGHSLSRTLHNSPVTVLLEGEIGTGKTTFMKGFAQGLGIQDTITSPTYALEQRYETQNHGTLIHIDLYRLNTAQSDDLLRSCEDEFSIRCIEWPENSGHAFDEQVIRLHFSEDGGAAGRRLRLTFDEIPLPTNEQIDKWREEVLLPEHIIAHCEAVGSTAEKVGKALLDRGIIARPHVLLTAGKMHDLLKFVDFDGSQDHLFPDMSDRQSTWNVIKARFANMKHEEACCTFLHDHGFEQLGTIIKPHGSAEKPGFERTMTEQLILYYADKRVCNDRVVTIAERFEDFRNRYADGKMTPLARKLEDEALEAEKRLFPDGPPF